MSQATTFNLQPLERSLRGKLERVVRDARNVVEEAAWSQCRQLGVGQAKPNAHLSNTQRDLRCRLRTHGHQLGDKRTASGEQKLDRLVEEIAYEHWHRMLFARFLAENQLLMSPDADGPAWVTIEACEELASAEGAKNGWELAARFAARMLPQIFRIHSPVFSLVLPLEQQQQLERLLAELPTHVFTASDSLGWVYQFWQAKRKDAINASEVKIGVREISPVTQLFTDPYMVSFLLDNSLGAWWASQRLTSEELRTAGTEQELREKASVPGVPLQYLRFVWDEDCGAWAPAAGTFDSWPESLAALKTLDPCCGSGHFLVAALSMLAPMRMEMEGLSAREAVDCVLIENLYGLEIDQRCAELAAFALALAAWRFPDAGGYRPLSDLNVACCGLSVSVAKEEWKQLAEGNKQLETAFDGIQDQLSNAPVLGSLLNPASSDSARTVSWQELAPLLDEALRHDQSDESREAVVVAHGSARAIATLGRQYHLAVTNVPYLGSSAYSATLSEFSDSHYQFAKSDLATMMWARILDALVDGGVSAVVVPQSWMFLKGFEQFRKRLFRLGQFRCIARLGPGAFESISGEVVQAALVTYAKSSSADQPLIALIDAAARPGKGELAPSGKADLIAGRSGESVLAVSAQSIVESSAFKFSFLPTSATEALSDYAYSWVGIQTGDSPRWIQRFWEQHDFSPHWILFQLAPNRTQPIDGCHAILRWDTFDEMASLPGSRIQGMQANGSLGVLIQRMADLKTCIYLGRGYDTNTAVVAPKQQADLLPLLRFCSSPSYAPIVRDRAPGLSITNNALIQIPYDVRLGASVYPEATSIQELIASDDPTQWVFHGHPASSVDPLQVAVARLLGYRWPAELDDAMELSTETQQWVGRSAGLVGLADDDGIVCIPTVGTEQSAEDRLLNLLHRAYEDGRAAGADLPDCFNDWVSMLLAKAGHGGKSLQTWLRDRFFTGHCRLFHHRPFIWHIWDGLKDGFSVLVNYHRLDNKLLKTLTDKYLANWISRQQRDRNVGVDGSKEKLAAAEWLKQRLELILHGESPSDLFVRWKSIQEQPIGWNPDLNDGVRVNIRPWMTVGDVGRKGAGLLRDKPNIHWRKDRGRDVESAPWYNLGPEYGGKQGDRINDHHLTLEQKQTARRETDESAPS